jgi:hypothetical protein
MQSSKASDESLLQLGKDSVALHKKYSDERDYRAATRMGLVSKTMVGSTVVASAILGFLAGRHMKGK